MSTFDARSSPSNAALAGGAAAPFGQRTGKWAAVALAVGAESFLSRLARSQSRGMRTVTRVPSPSRLRDRQLAAVKPEQAFDDGETEAGAAVAAVV